MTEPFFWRVVLNPIRRFLERDDRMLVPHWKAVLGPPPPSNVRPFINLLVTRSAQKRKVA